MGRKLGGARPSHAPSAFGSLPFKNYFIHDSAGTGGGGAQGLVGLVRVSLSSSEWGLKARACAPTPTCAWAASDLVRVRPVG